jgi:hypothetical protein
VIGEARGEIDLTQGAGLLGLQPGVIGDIRRHPVDDRPVLLGGYLRLHHREERLSQGESRL